MGLMLTVECVDDGRHARFVDGGRPALRHLAIARGGAADRESAAAGNRLLEQAPNHCCIEMTLRGGHWMLRGRGQLTLTGADMGWHLDGEPVDRYRTITLDGHHELRGGLARTGCRGYVCLRGHWELPRVMESVEAGLPGVVEPRRGLRFDVKWAGEVPHRIAWTSDAGLRQEVTVQVVPGPEWRLVSQHDRQSVVGTEYRVGRHSDRQGIRLESEALPRLGLPEMISSPVVPGTVQWTDGGPILLGPDAQTVGGYPRVLLAAPLPDAVFQLRPGGALRFSLLKAGL